MEDSGLPCVGDKEKVYIDYKSVLGSGGYGKVLAGRYEGKDVAVKKIDILLAKNEKKRYCREVDILRGLHEKPGKDASETYDNIVRYYYHHEDHFSLYIVLERCQCSLDKYLHQKMSNEALLDMEIALKIIYQATCGVEFLHEQNILHRDLKPANILLADEDGKLRVKLTDFGFSMYLKHGQTSASSENQGGTRGYKATELLNAKKNKGRKSVRINYAIDIFALGIVYYVVLSYKHPFGDDDLDKEKNIKDKKPPDLSNVWRWPNAQALISGMISHDKNQRPKAKVAKEEVKKIGETYPPKSQASSLSLCEPFKNDYEQLPETHEHHEEFEVAHEIEAKQSMELDQENIVPEDNAVQSGQRTSHNNSIVEIQPKKKARCTGIGQYLSPPLSSSRQPEVPRKRKKPRRRKANVKSHAITEYMETKREDSPISSVTYSKGSSTAENAMALVPYSAPEASLGAGRRQVLSPLSAARNTSLVLATTVTRGAVTGTPQNKPRLKVSKAEGVICERRNAAARFEEYVRKGKIRTDPQEVATLMTPALWLEKTEFSLVTGSFSDADRAFASLLQMWEVSEEQRPVLKVLYEWAVECSEDGFRYLRSVLLFICEAALHKVVSSANYACDTIVKCVSCATEVILKFLHSTEYMDPNQAWKIVFQFVMPMQMKMVIGELDPLKGARYGMAVSIAKCCRCFSEVCVHLKDFEDAAKSAEIGLSFLTDPNKEKILRSNLLDSCGIGYLGRRNYSMARKCFEKAISLKTKANFSSESERLRSIAHTRQYLHGIPRFYPPLLSIENLR